MMLLLLTMVAVKGMLSIREEARAETHITKMMAIAKRWSSGTAWEGRQKEELVRTTFVTAQMQAANLGFQPNMPILCTGCTRCVIPPAAWSLLKSSFYLSSTRAGTETLSQPVGWGGRASQTDTNTAPVTCD